MHNLESLQTWARAVFLALKAKCLLEMARLSLREILIGTQMIEKEEGKHPEKQMSNFFKSFQNQM